MQKNIQWSLKFLGMIVQILSLNDDDDDAKALPTGVPKDDAMKKGGWGGQNVSKSDGVILVCSRMGCFSVCLISCGRGFLKKWSCHLQLHFSQPFLHQF